MKSKSEILQVIKDPELGDLGWVCKSKLPFLRQIDSGVPITGGGQLIAHDLLEHVSPAGIGGVSEELMALGAVQYVRGWTGQVRPHSLRNSAHELGYDVAEMLTRCDTWDIVDAPKTNKLDEFDDDIDEILIQARRSAKREYCDDQEILSRLPDYLEAARHYLRKGFRLARKKYKDFPNLQNGLYSLFFSIADAVDNHMIECEGQTVKLIYGSSGVYLEEYYGDEYYEA